MVSVAGFVIDRLTVDGYGPRRGAYAVTLLLAPASETRMPTVPKDIYAGAAMRRLLADETNMLLPELQACSGEHGLLVSASPSDMPPALPLLACWTRLWVDAGRYRGDLAACADESLPFVDHAFELVVLQHALERSSSPDMLLREVCRVLMPGGLLAVTGVHPLGLWGPWMAWKSRAQTTRTHWPLQVGEWFRRENVQVECVKRAGRTWPGAGVKAKDSPDGVSHQVLGGAFVMVGRKQRSLASLRPRRAHLSAVPAGAALAPGAQRLSA